MKLPLPCLFLLLLESSCQLFISADETDLVENEQDLCKDGVDNDGDTAIDCEDDECAPFCRGICGDGISVAGESCFSAPVSVAVGTEPRAIGVADLDNDGDQDVAAANFGSDNVSILQGDNTGALSLALTLSTPIEPTSLKLGDLNGDALLDLVIVAFADARFQVFRNDGALAFSSVATLSTLRGPDSLVLSDIDVDGQLDLVAACQDDNSLTIRLNQGGFSFGFPLNQAVGNGPNGLASADFNNDNRPDLLVANFLDNTIEFIRNDPLALVVSSAQQSGTDPEAIAVDDLDGDSLVDVVSANGVSNDVTVFLQGRAFAPQSFAAAPAAFGDAAVSLGHIDNDSTIDAVVSGNNGGGLSILFGRGDGTFAAPVVLAAGSSLMSPIIADLNSDAFPDLIAADLAQQSILVLLGEP